MTDPKKPGPSGASGTFEPLRPSLGPAPMLRLPPPQRSIASMAPLKVTPERVSSGAPPTASDAPPALPTLPALGPPVVITDAPGPMPAPRPAPLRSPAPAPLHSLAPAPVPSRTRRWVLFALLAAVLAGGAFLVVRSRRGSVADAASAALGHVGVFASTLDVRTFQRGNIHTHTTRSDGRQSPEEVAAWYRDHGYQFLVLSDHDVLVDPSEVHDVERPGFILIPGEEITSTAPDKQVHVLGLCIGHVIPSGHFETAAAALNAAVAGVRAQNGVVVVNHPNLGWSLSLADIAPLQGSYALEIWSGHPGVRSSGDATHLSHEALWDELRTRGRDVTAVAVDDEHTLVASQPGDALPGKAWIQTFGELGRAPVCDALQKGRLYASSGVALRRIRVERGRFTVWVDDPRDEVEFIANAAHLLALVPGDELVHDEDGYAASYTLRGGETFVRAVVRAPDGGAAWTQAYDTRP